MALQEAHQAFKFAGGVETETDSKAVPPVRLLALENGVFSRASSIKKRNGYSLLSRAIDGSTSLITGAKRLARRDDEMLLFTSSRCYSKQSADQWTDAGALIAPTGQDRPAVHTGSQQTTPDHATVAGVTVHAWEDSNGGVWWTVEDATNGSIYRAPTQADALGQRPRCLAVNNVLHIYYAVPSLQRIDCIVVNPSRPTAAVAPKTLVNDLDSTNPVYDAVTTHWPGLPSLMVWHEHATTSIRLGFVDGSGTLGSPASGFPSVFRDTVALATASPLAIAFKPTYVEPIDESNPPGDIIAVFPHDELAVAYQTGTDLKVSFYGVGLFAPTSFANEGTQVIGTATTINRIAAAYTADGQGKVWVVAEENAAQASQHFCVVNWADSTPQAGALTTVRGVKVASRAFQAGNSPDVFAMLMHDTTYFNTYVTLRLSDFAPAGRHLTAQAAAPTRSHLPYAHVSDGIVNVVVPRKQRLASEDNDKFTETALSRVTMDFDTEDSHQTAQLGSGLYMAAACPQHYDGRLWTEQGFHFGPELIPTTPAAGGSLTVSSTYLYKVWYEWTDAQGEIHRGPESIGTSVVLGASDTQVTLTLPTYRVTRKTNVRICVARSLPGDTARCFRVTSLDPTTVGAVNGYVANSTTVDSVTFVDRMSDATLRKQELIYTTGGVLSNDPTALGSHIAGGKNRLFYTDSSTGNIVRFTQRLAFGFGVEIAPELQHEVDQAGGDITGLATMDDVVYVFKASAVHAFNGDGPYEDGTNTTSSLVAGFSASQIITSDVGCTDPSSIVLAPQGLMFKSAKGIYRISRSREVEYVGAPVEAHNAQNVRRATVMPDRPAVLFLTDSGVSLYFDYRFQQWSTFTNHEGYDAVVVDNTFHYLRTNNVVFRETIGVHADGTSRITLRFETAWLHLHEHLQGFQRFWRLLLLGTWSSPHQLSVAHRMNYDEAWSDPYYLDATGASTSAGWITGDSANTIGEDPILGSSYGDALYGDGVYGGAGPDVYQWRYGIHEAGQAIQFRFEDFEKAGLAGASFELTEMTITGGIMKPDIRPFSGARST